MRAALVATTFALASAWAGPCLGHAMPNSTVVISAAPAGWDAAVSIPLSELSAALGAPVREGVSDRTALRAYILGHVAVTGAERRAWPASVTRLEFDNIERPTLEVSLSFAAPADAAGRAATFRYDAVTHRIASHYVLVYLRDAQSGDVRALGRLQAPAATLSLTRP